MYPLIKNCEWGKAILTNADNSTTVYGGDNKRSDFIAYKDHHEEWDWNNPKTLVKRHMPGVQMECIKYLVDKGCTRIVIAKGYGDKECSKDGMLRVHANIVNHFQSKGIKITIVNSKDVKDAYNKRCKKREDVGLLYHGTC